MFAINSHFQETIHHSLMQNSSFVATKFIVVNFIMLNAKFNDFDANRYLAILLLDLLLHAAEQRRGLF